ncbi:uncharacterized protein EI90DRAFT_2903207, partial [Cantharellus anzutake]|uniref:uncharacterized protein n=1 Tax=Cantharellus anzutake TaxID=1750568 RepID=UPI001903CCB9
DPFYGHEDTAKMSAAFISHLFACPDLPPPSNAVTSTGAPIPSPKLANFVAYALHRTRLPSSVTFASLFLLQRLKARFPAARGSSGHRLFISAFMIASKVICDDTYSNKSWCVVGQGMFSLREINQMEREMCGYLDWQLNVPQTDLEQFTNKVQGEFASSHKSTVFVTVPFYQQRPPFKGASSDSPPDGPGSPSHSDTSSPASTSPATPSNSEDSAPHVVVGSHPHGIPKTMATGGVVEKGHIDTSSSSNYAFAAPAVW